MKLLNAILWGLFFGSLFWAIVVLLWWACPSGACPGTGY